MTRTAHTHIPNIITGHSDEVAVLDRTAQSALLHEVARGRAAAERLASGTVTEDERRALEASVRVGIRAKNRLIVSNLRLVATIARTAARRGTWMTVDDLIQEGAHGLGHAIDKFDRSYGTALSTYATWWIRQAIDRAVANSGLIRIPVHAQDTPAKRRDPELRRLTDLDSVDSILESQRRADEAEMWTDEMWAPHYDRPAFANAQDEYEHVDMSLDLGDVLTVLTERQAYVIRRRFGFGCDPVTLETIGHDLGLTRERVRQIEKQAIDRLREQLGIEAGAFAMAA